MCPHSSLYQLLLIGAQLMIWPWVMAGGQALNASVPTGWLGTYKGTCSMHAWIDATGHPQCTNSSQETTGGFTTIITWDEKAKKLQLAQNVSWTTSNKGSFDGLPQTLDRHTVTIVDQNIKFDIPGIQPLCLHQDVADIPTSYGIVVYAGTYLEISVFKTSDFAVRQWQPAWSCPTSMDSRVMDFICETTTFNYKCQGVLISQPAPQPSPLPPPASPTPELPVSPLSSPMPSPTIPAASPLPFVPVPPPSLPSPSLSPPPKSPATPSPRPSPTPLTDPTPPLTTAAAPPPTAAAISSPSHSRTTVLAAAVGGAAGFILLIAAVTAWMVHKGWCTIYGLCSSQAKDASDATDGIAKGLKDDVVLHVGPVRMPIQGVLTGDPFLKTTAPQYSWTVQAADRSQYVQAGITDMYLDSMAVDGQPGPCLQLTSAQVCEEIEVLTTGLLGRGGAAFVFMCRWRKRFGDGLLAIKLLKDAFDTPVTVLQSFEYEGRLLSAIRHPHVVQLYGWCMDLPHVCLIMELLPGSLEGLLYQTGLGSSRPTTGTGSQPGQYTPQAHATHSSNNSYAPALGAMYSPGSSNVSPAVPSATASPVAVSTDSSRGMTSGGMSHSSGQTPTSPTTPASTAPLSSISQSTHVSTQQRLSMQAVLQIAADLAAALAYLHDRQVTGVPNWGPGEGAAEQRSAWDPLHGAARAAKVVHRDLKPANVLINSNGRAKLSDFGLARENASTTIHTMHMNAGTLAYMAPELLALGHTRPTNRVDIYGLGIMMWELVEHRKPWQDTNQAQLVSAVVSGKRPRIQESSLFSGRSSIYSPPLSPSSPQQQTLTSSAQPTNPVDWSQVPADFSACPELADLVRECWHQREYKRPAAADVLRRLQALMGPVAQDGDMP